MQCYCQILQCTVYRYNGIIKMMKKLYIKPAIDIKSFDNENIVTSSGGGYSVSKANNIVVYHGMIQCFDGLTVSFKMHNSLSFITAPMCNGAVFLHHMQSLYTITHSISLNYVQICIGNSFSFKRRFYLMKSYYSVF